MAVYRRSINNRSFNVLQHPQPQTLLLLISRIINPNLAFQGNVSGSYGNYAIAKPNNDFKIIARFCIHLNNID